MKPVTIYTTNACPYCRMAKDLLRRKNIEFDEIDVLGNSGNRSAMVARANGRTSVPQIFIGATHVGGCDDIHALEQQGKLDALLVTA
jgi:glutaredoxin 3